MSFPQAGGAPPNFLFSENRCPTVFIKVMKFSNELSFLNVDNSKKYVTDFFHYKGITYLQRFFDVLSFGFLKYKSMFSTLLPLFLKIQQLLSTVKMTKPFLCDIRIFFKTLVSSFYQSFGKGVFEWVVTTGKASTISSWMLWLA